MPSGLPRFDCIFDSGYFSGDSFAVTLILVMSSGTFKNNFPSSGGETPNGGRQVKNKQDAERTQRTENKNPLRSASFTISENKKKKI